MRFRIPPFLPPYAVLFLVIAYAAGFLWLGLTRLDAIARVSESAGRSIATIHELQAFLNALNDIETAGRGFALTGDEKYLEPFERGRSRVSALLAELRDKVRDDPAELAYVQQLVPLIAERIMITATAIERKKTTPDTPYTFQFGRRGDETSEAMRSIINALDKRETDELTHAGDTLERILLEARRDLFVLAAITLVLVVALFMAVRRLRAFIPAVPPRPPAAIAPAGMSHADDAGAGLLIRDALLRARLAAASATADSTERTRLHTLATAMERALAEDESLERESNESASEDKGVVAALTLLQRAYSRSDGVVVKATIDRSARLADPQKAFLLYRSAEWALEAILHRKRAGDVELQLVVNRNGLFLRVHALIDNSNRPAALTPKESEEASALQRGLAAFGGTFDIGEAPTGFSLALHIPPEA